MKKTLVTLLAVMTMGICCSSALASDVSVKVGYNLAGTSDYSISTEKVDNVETYKLNAGNGGGLVIGADVNTAISGGFGVKASFTADYMKKTFEKGGSLAIVVGEGNKIEIKEADGKSKVEIKKWTLAGDALVTYNFVKSVPGLSAGVQAGVNFSSSNAYDMLIPFAAPDVAADESAGTAAKTTQSTIDGLKDKFNVSGGAAVVGAFVNYDYNDKLSLAADGYIGVLKFGDLASAFSNYKVNASLSYEVYNNIAIKAGFTFANTTFEKTVDSEIFGEGNFDKISNAGKDGGKDTNTFVYSYKQMVPSIGVSYTF